MHQLFISYSSADRGWAEVLEKQLLPHLPVYCDKTRLTVSKPIQELLFSGLQDSSALLIIWSRRVRDMQGEWKEWVITERERFRALHPEGPIIYVLLDEQVPQVDAHVHKLDALAGRDKPDVVDEATWGRLIQDIKTVVLPPRVELDCYVLACTAPEFATLKEDPNLGAVLRRLGLDFDHVAGWYGDKREVWRPAGALSVLEILSDLEAALTAVLTEEGVPDLLKPIFYSLFQKRLVFQVVVRVAGV